MAIANVVAFNAEWFDQVASMARKFRINHFKDGTLEIINLFNRQTFLKRTYFEDVSRSDFFLGATVTLNCRQFCLVEYADPGTKLHFEGNSVRLFGLVKPEAMGALGPILTAVQGSFGINRLKMVELDSAAAGRFGCARGAALAMEASLLGADPDVGARWEYFVAAQRGAMSGSAGGASSGEDAAWCFEEAPAASGARGSDTTACVVKPHVVKEGRVGELVGEVQALGFRVEAMGMLSLDLNSATAFFEVYKGVLPHYAGMVGHMAEGPVVFLGLSGGPGVVDEFREACGPPDVELARTLRPKSLRARFGTDRVKNAVHCTDLSVDGGLEVGYFMQLLGL